MRVIGENKVDALKQYKLGTAGVAASQNARRLCDGSDDDQAAGLRSAKKYPVMSFTYSGPHAPQVRNAWGSQTYMLHQLLAQKGYIIWVCDNRTASGKGIESTWPVYKNFGELELRDLEDGLTWLKSQPYVDGSRIGMWGWSYGGFMTSYALTHSQSFKIGYRGRHGR